MDEKDAVVTDHANKRIRERVGVSKKTTKTLANKALVEGLDHSELKGSLKRFVNGLYMRSKSANNIKVLHDKAYIFKDTVLITVLSLPHNLARVSSQLLKKKAK
ncbi:hypothetical protein N9948_00625 [bacterium]|nr:hypothetical protein [bacterium]